MKKPVEKRTTSREAAIATIRQAGANWPSTFLSRSEVKKFTGGLCAVGSLANEDSAGTGPEGSFRLGRRVCYSVEGFCDWLISRLNIDCLSPTKGIDKPVRISQRPKGISKPSKLTHKRTS